MVMFIEKIEHLFSLVIFFLGETIFIEFDQLGFSCPYILTPGYMLTIGPFEKR